jgi:hypothetical protein
MMRKMMILAVVAVCAAGALSSCASHNKSAFGRTHPDEFAVSRQAPLVVPPDFALVPPKPGAPRPQDADASTQALQAMFGGPAQRSAVEGSTLNNAGGDRAAGGIRSNAGDPNTATVDKGSITRDVIAAPEGDGQTAKASAGK